MGRPPKVQPPRRPNPITNLRPIRKPTPIVGNIARKALAGATKARRLCPNKTCPAPKIEDGVCQTCGTIVNDSNIVAEVQFGENSSGAAVVQGSFVSADQGTAKSLGPAFRRAGGQEDREKSLREGNLTVYCHWHRVLIYDNRNSYYAWLCWSIQTSRGGFNTRHTDFQAGFNGKFHTRSTNEHGGCMLLIYRCKAEQSMFSHAHRLCRRLCSM
jgi:hypothetical protein